MKIRFYRVLMSALHKQLMKKGFLQKRKLIPIYYNACITIAIFYSEKKRHIKVLIVDNYTRELIEVKVYQNIFYKTTLKEISKRIKIILARYDKV